MINSHSLLQSNSTLKKTPRFFSLILCLSLVGGRGLQCFTLYAAVALPHSNLVFQHSLGISGFELDLHYCQLPVAEEVQPDHNSCPAVLTVVWIVLDSVYTKQISDHWLDFLHRLLCRQRRQRPHPLARTIELDKQTSRSGVFKLRRHHEWTR